MSEYIVDKERSSETNEPVQLVKNEVIECIEESNSEGDWPNWIYCKSQNKEGWVPKQIIKKEDTTKGVILEDYDATEFDLCVGDVILAEKHLNGWIYGAKKENLWKKAWAPLNYLKKL